MPRRSSWVAVLSPQPPNRDGQPPGGQPAITLLLVGLWVFRMWLVDRCFYLRPSPSIYPSWALSCRPHLRGLEQRLHGSARLSVTTFLFVQELCPRDGPAARRLLMAANLVDSLTMAKTIVGHRRADLPGHSTAWSTFRSTRCPRCGSPGWLCLATGCLCGEGAVPGPRRCLGVLGFDLHISWVSGWLPACGHRRNNRPGRRGWRS
jgi:hypothetical protein